jgi:Na+-transporting methylmalonyl-CoA/oxaloacetate decarboxylase gamma subunit
MKKKKIIVAAILLFILGIAFVVLFRPHLSSINATRASGAK